MTNIPSIEKMLKSGMHFGHRTSKWHPKMAPFIFTKRNGVHIVDLIQTRTRLKEALEFMQKMKAVLVGEGLHIVKNSEQIHTIAWCSGAAQSYIEAAAELGVDAYLTGEISEQTVHIARENGLHFYSAGHHATERYGVQAFGEHLASHFSIKQL